LHVQNTYKTEITDVKWFQNCFLEPTTEVPNPSGDLRKVSVHEFGRKDEPSLPDFIESQVQKLEESSWWKPQPKIIGQFWLEAFIFPHFDSYEISMQQEFIKYLFWVNYTKW
jgi:hypothetical protein